MDNEKTFRLVIEEIVRSEHILTVSASDIDTLRNKLNSIEGGRATNIYDYNSKLMDEDIFTFIADENYEKDISIKCIELTEK